MTSAHERFARGAGEARRFIPEVSPLAGLARETADGWSALAEMSAPRERVGLFLDGAVPEGWRTLAEGPLLQMVHDGGPVDAPDRPLLDLAEDDAPEMRALAALTKPGPFGPRTHELGSFQGVRVGGRLAAMTGERLRLPGFTEISAVCTHPEHLGRGHAAALLRSAAARIRARGETPFLHVRADNARAIGLYERLGFRRGKLSRYVILTR